MVSWRKKGEVCDMDEKTTNKMKLKESFLKYGVLYFVVGAGLILVYYCINHVSVLASGLAKINDILMPFYLGIIMAYLMCPLYNATVRWLYRAKKERSAAPLRELRLAKFLATIVAVLAILGIVVGFFALIGPDLWESVTGLVLGIPEATAKVQNWINAHIVENPALVDLLEDKLENISTMAIEWAQEKLLPGAGAILSGVVGTLSMVADFFVALIICIYILNSKEAFSAQGKKLVLAVCKPQKAEKIFTFGKICNETFGGFINGKIIDSIIIGILCFIAMSALKLPMAILISVVVGVTNIIPFFGPFIGAIPSILILLIVEPIAALKFAIMVLVLQQLDGNVIGPKILGKTTKLASFWVMFAIIVGGGLFGLPGMILGVPVFAVIYAYTSGAINSKLREKEMPTDTLVYEDFSKYRIDKEEVFGKERFEAARRVGEHDTEAARRE